MAPGSLANVGGFGAIASARTFAFSLGVTAFAFVVSRVADPALAAGALCRR